jgi:hypothetical protein
MAVSFGCEFVSDQQIRTINSVRYFHRVWENAEQQVNRMLHMNLNTAQKGNIEVI